MKVAGRPVAALLHDPSRVNGILLYGPDQGLVRDRSNRAAQSVLGDQEGPFRFVVLPGEEHGRLREEAFSLALGGGRRVIRVQDATDALAPVLDKLLDQLANVLVLVEAGSLTPRSKLRLIAEREARWAAVACFPEPRAAVAADIGAALIKAGITVTPDALGFLTDELSNDFARRKSELEKLSLFVADDGRVDLERAHACCAGQLEASLGLAVSAAMAGNRDLADRLLGELEREGATGPGLLAVLSMEMHRVLRVKALMEQGVTGEEACRSLTPPVYPRQTSAFLAEVRCWPIVRLEWLSQMIRLADLSCKRAGSHDFTIAAHLLSSLSVGEDMGLSGYPSTRAGHSIP